MKSVVVIVVASLLLSASARADDAENEELETTSYRTYTITTDLVGISLLFAAAATEGDNGRDSTASDRLFAIGGLTTLLGTPAIHASRGHAGRAVGSFFMRAGLASAGAMLAFSAANGCTDGWFCEFDYAGYGAMGGLVIASVIDAAFMTDEKVERALWTPQLTASKDGVRAGLALTW